MADLERKDWVHSFFGGKRDFYGRVYKSLEKFSPEKTKEEVNGVISLLRPKPETHILDWCGGWGRHAILLAREGFEVTLLDFCQEYLEEAEREAKRVGVKLNLVHADFRETPPEIQADYVINMFTAGLGFLSEEDDVFALKSLFAAIKPGARFLIDTMCLFYIVRNYQKAHWDESPDQTKRYLEQRHFDFWTNTNRAKYIYQETETGLEDSDEISVRTYSPAELARVLKIAGFEPLELYGALDGSEFSFDSRRIVMISQKP